MVDDYLFMGPLIVERLKTIPELKKVITAAELAVLSDNAPTAAPSAYVIYHSDTTPDSVHAQGNGRTRQVVAQNWIVCLVVKTTDSTGLNSRSDQKAGALMSKTMAALMGHIPPGHRGVIAPIGRSGLTLPVVYADGYSYYPLVFKTHFVW